MTANQKKILTWVVSGILALGVVGCGLFVKVAATVDGEKITLDEIDRAGNRIVLEHKESPISKEKREARLQVLNFLIDDVLYRREAEKLGIKVTDREVEAEVNLEKKPFPSEAAFLKSLTAARLTLNDFRDSIRNKLIRKAVNKKIVKRGKLTDKEMRDYYKKNRDQFNRPEQVKIGFVQVRTQEEAQDVLARIRGGMDFEKAEAMFSIDPTVKAEGIQSRFVQRGKLTRLSPRLEELAFTLAPGEVTEPVETPIGWTLMKVYEKKAATKGTFEDFKDDIEKMLKISKWRTEARTKATIKIYL